MTTDHSDFFSLSEQIKVCILNFCAHTRLRDKRGSTTSQRKLSDTPINSLHQRQCARILTKTPRCRDMGGQIIPNHHNHFTKKGGNSNITYHKLAIYIFFNHSLWKRIGKAHVAKKGKNFSLKISGVLNYFKLHQLKENTSLNYSWFHPHPPLVWRISHVQHGLSTITHHQINIC